MTEPRRRVEKLPLLPDRRPPAYALALAFSAVAFLLRWQLDGVLPPGFPYLTFFPAVILSSFLFGRGPGLAAAIVCGLLAWYWFIPPRRSLSLTGSTAVALAFYIGVVWIDLAVIHWMQRANGRLMAERERSGALAERTELLFSELQHRVANNLQMAGAVLAMQRRTITDEAARQALAEAAAKLQLIGRIQRQLYGTAGEQVALDVFLAQLADDLVAAGGKPGVRHAIDAEPGILLPPDAAIPLALVMAEGVANAIEHGFADRDQGLIRITLARRDGAIELGVADDGCGLPDGFDPSAGSSLGLRVARSLAERLGASLSFAAGDPGTRMRLLLPTPAAG